MSFYDYQASMEIYTQDYPFYGLLMALMRKADDNNAEKLKFAFPEVWDELKERYNTPGGLTRKELQVLHDRENKEATWGGCPKSQLLKLVGPDEDEF
jgi:hypothetical protein